MLISYLFLEKARKAMEVPQKTHFLWKSNKLALT